MCTALRAPQRRFRSRAAPLGEAHPWPGCDILPQLPLYNRNYCHAQGMRSTAKNLSHLRMLGQAVHKTLVFSGVLAHVSKPQHTCVQGRCMLDIWVCEHSRTISTMLRRCA